MEMWEAFAVLGSEPLLCPAEFIKDPFEWFLRSEGTAKSWGWECGEQSMEVGVEA